MPDIKVKGYSGNDLVYQNVDKIYFRKSDDSGTVPFSYGDAVSKTVEPDFSSGDMSVEIAEGELVKEMTIAKPEDLAPENIRAGRKIGNVPGEFIGDTEEATVGSVENGDTHDLNFAEEDFITIEPSAEGKVLSKVTIAKPADLLPENIVKDKVIGGVVGNLAMTSGAEATIDPDFTNGDMEVTPAEGTHFSKVTVEKPDNLLPENIAEGIDIAGIIGTLVAGGGGEFKYFRTNLNFSSWTLGQRVELNIGFAPDVLIIYRNGSGTETCGLVWFGISTACGTAMGYPITFTKNFVVSLASGTYSRSTSSFGIDASGNTSRPIYAANATGFNLGVSVLATDKAYEVIAIGGLS